MFLIVSFSSEGGGSHVAIIHDVLNLTVQQNSSAEHGTSLYRDPLR